MIRTHTDTHKYRVLRYVQVSPFLLRSPHTIVSFLFPNERDFLSFLLFCDVGEESGDEEDDRDDEEEQDKGDEEAGLGVVLLHGEVGADWEAAH